MAQPVKNPPAIQKTQVWSLGWKDFVEKGIAPYSSILAWKIPWTEEPGRLQSMGPQRVGHNWAHTRTHTIGHYLAIKWCFPGGSEVKASACNAGDLGSIPGSGRFPGEGNGNPLQYSCLENPMGGGAWWATVHGVAKSQTWLNDFTSLMKDILVASKFDS